MLVADPKNKPADRLIRAGKRLSYFALVMVALFTAAAIHKVITQVTDVLIAVTIPFFATLLIICLIYTRLQGYIKQGQVLKIEDDVYKAYRTLEKSGHLSGSADLFRAQQRVNAARKEILRRWHQGVVDSA